MTDQEKNMIACLGILLYALESVRLETRASWQGPGEERGKLSAQAEQQADRAQRAYIQFGKALGWDGRQPL